MLGTNDRPIWNGVAAFGRRPAQFSGYCAGARLAYVGRRSRVRADLRGCSDFSINRGARVDGTADGFVPRGRGNTAVNSPGCLGGPNAAGARRDMKLGDSHTHALTPDVELPVEDAKRIWRTG